MMWAFILSGVGRWVAGGAIVAVLLGGLYVKGRIDGNAACEAKQAAQMAKMEAYVKKVRDSVERNQPLDDDILRSDPFQRE